MGVLVDWYKVTDNTQHKKNERLRCKLTVLASELPRLQKRNRSSHRNYSKLTFIYRLGLRDPSGVGVVLTYNNQTDNPVSRQELLLNKRIGKITMPEGAAARCGW